MMYRKAAVAMLFAVAFAAAPVLAADPTPAPSPDAAEAAFVARIQADLNKRFPTTADAIKAGYIRYTDEDDTGVISYANRQWTSADPAHPSQLWYDVKGRLVGADFSVPYAADAKPTLWGVDPARWSRFGEHIHYGLVGPNGTVKFGGTSAKKYEAAGGDPLHPTADGLVKAGAVTSADQVKFTFVFPAIWDLEVWTLPNPSGAFAEKNPNLVPSANAKSMD
jgi:hypothetical protein